VAEGKMNKYSGSNFDDFLAEEGILEEVSARALKRLLALQIADIMTETNLSKTRLAARMNTSRSQLDRLLDPDNTAVTLETLDRLAHAMGKQLKIQFS
jgi:DNA-binding Xre family transcriptional regulator